MHYRQFPRTDIRVSEVGFGVWTVATDWWGVTDDDLRRRLLRDAWHEHGINFFDTADTYGDGLGETILRQTLGEVRDRIVIATKFGYDLSHTHGRSGHRERGHNWSADFVRRACEASLERLGTDRIDLYQLHNPRIDAIGSDELLRTLEHLQTSGKVRAIGVALGPAINERQIDEGVTAARRGYHSLQIIYNLLEQMLGPANFNAAGQHDAGILVRVPHSSGLLEGNLAPDTTFPEWDHRSHRPGAWLTEGLEKVGQLDFLTAGGRRTLGQAALKFILHQPTVMATLPNLYNPDQLAEFAATSDTPDLTDDERQRVESLYRHNFGVQPAGT